MVEANRPSTVAVTGSAGLIGAAVVRRLAGAGWTVFAAERLGPDQRYRNLAGVTIADYMDADDFLERIGRDQGVPPIGAMVHVGACSSTIESDGHFLMHNNFGYTRALARWCLRKGVRFVYASSAATYGAGERGYNDAAELLPELRPQNKYALSKHLLDLWALKSGAFVGRNGITGLKYFNVYGPGEGHKGEMRSMVRKAFEQIENDGVVRLFKSCRPEWRNGEQERDFLYVDDAAAITAWFLDHPEATGIFNVGSGEARTWNSLAEASFRSLDSESRIEYIEMPESIRGAYQYSTRADITRLRAAGCDLPIRSLEQGVADYAAAWRAGTA